MKRLGYFKEIYKMVDTIVEEKFIKDGNSPYPAGSRLLTKTCLNNSCKYLKGCKIQEFNNIEYR